MSELDQRFEIASDVHARRFDDEIVILDLRAGTYMGLDEVGASIWSHITSGKSLAEVAAALIIEYDVDEERVRQDLISFVGTLVERNLLRRAA